MSNGDEPQESDKPDLSSEPLDKQAKHLLERFQGKAESGPDKTLGGASSDAKKIPTESSQNRKPNTAMDSNDQEMVDAPPVDDAQDQLAQVQNGKDYNSEEGDMLMAYSRSDVAPESTQTDQNGAATVAVPGDSSAPEQQAPTNGQGLANSSELSEDDKKLQQRYFAVTTLSDAEGIENSENMVLRCLCCGVVGHRQDDCPELKVSKS